MNGELQRWELLGADGETIHGLITVEMLERCGVVTANRAAIRQGWPPLAPDTPWITCTLTGGPLDGLWEYLDPGLFDGPPDELTFTGYTLISAVAGAAATIEDMPGMAVSVYRVRRQLCRHGNLCPYPYWHGSR